MHPLQRQPSITTQAFDTVEQAGVCCASCTPIPIISGVGSVVVIAARLAHSVYTRFRRGSGKTQPQPEIEDTVSTQNQSSTSNRSMETANYAPSAKVVIINDDHLESKECSDSDNNSSRHVIITLHQNSDDDITGVEISDVRTENNSTSNRST